MAFYQNNNNINTQYNIDINFGETKTKEAFFQALEQVQEKLGTAIEEKAITGEKALEAEMYIKKALLQSEQIVPDKKSLIEHLTAAKALVSNVDGLVVALGSAIATIGALF